MGNNLLKSSVVTPGLTRFRRGRPETARSLLRCSCHVAQAQYILLLKRQRPDDTIPHRSTGLSVMWCIKRVSRLRVGRRLAADSLLVYMWVNVPYARPWQDSAVIVERRSRMEPAFVVCAGREWPRRRLESTPHQRPSRVLVLAHPRCLPARHLHLFPARSYRLPRLPPRPIRCSRLHGALCRRHPYRRPQFPHLPTKLVPQPPL